MSDSLMTPADLYCALEVVWGRPALDPCWHPSSPVDPFVAFSLVQHNAVEEAFGSREIHETDGLAADWSTAITAEPMQWVWLNPPYSDIAPWLEKAHESRLPVACLLPVNTSSKWWQDYCWTPGNRVGFFRKRLKFGRTDGGPQLGANFSSALVLINMPQEGYPTPDYPIKWVWSVK